MIRSFEDLSPENIGKYDNIAKITPRKVPWCDEVKRDMNKRAATPSQLYSWLEQELSKRRQNLENEIDINEIKAARMGIKNKWYKTVQKYPDLFKPLDAKKGKLDWAKILSAYQNTVEKNI